VVPTGYMLGIAYGMAEKGPSPACATAPGNGRA
jgi:hypothetical protein